MRRHRRRLLLIIGLPLYAAAVACVITVAMALLADPAEVLEVIGDIVWPLEAVWWIWCGVPALVIVATQAVFVVPILDVRIETRQRGRPVVRSMLIAALVAASLTLGLLFGLLELLKLWDRVVSSERGFWGWPIVLPVLALTWAFWSWIFLVFTRRRRPGRLLERVVALLLAGTVIEVLAVVPIDVMVRRRTDCYCATGTFHGLLIAILAATWLAGPGVAILYMRRRRRLAARFCDQCGYAKGPSPPATCPECGHAWLDD